jgi:RNA polymerase sigma factor (TIGR02999 family)
MSDVTQILNAIDQGDRHAANELLPLVYDELRRLAAQRLMHERPGQTLDATALVHEAYLRLVGPSDRKHWDSRGHFFAAAAEAMRQILIERARQRRAAKHGGELARVQLDSECPASDNRFADSLAINDALTELEKHDPQAAALVKLRYFVGLGHAEAAESLGITRRAADRLWALARAWLYRQLRDE